MFCKREDKLLETWETAGEAITATATHRFLSSLNNTPVNLQGKRHFIQGQIDKPLFQNGIILSEGFGEIQEDFHYH